MRPIKGTVTDEAALQAAYKADEARKRALAEGGFIEVERAENARGLADVWKRARSREELLDAAVEHLLQRLAVDEGVPVSVQIAAGEAFGILSGIEDEP